MLGPKKTKYRKAFKGRISGLSNNGSVVAFGSYALKTLDPARITARQIEASRKSINNYLKRKGKLWIRIFPDIPVSKKPAEVRMGSGKGSPEYFVARVAPGRIMFELDGVSREDAEAAFERASAKLPVRTKFIERIEI